MTMVICEKKFMGALVLCFVMICVESHLGNNLKTPPLFVQLTRHTSNQHVTIDNGLVRVTFSNPEGLITEIEYNGITNLLHPGNDDRGYWDVVWYEPGNPLQIDKILGTEFRVITQNENEIEISFTRKWSLSELGYQVPLNVDKRYIIRSGSSGIYMYGVVERLEGWPDVDMDQIRIVFKLDPNIFNFMAISNGRQRMMPTETDRNDDRSQPLAYKEAVLLTNPTNPAFRGEVDDKYQYSCEDKDNKVHGWVSVSDRPVGFWMITPSDEFRVGGPIKQDLTSHVGPITLSMFTSTHYAGKDLDTTFRNGEPWKKVFGPVFLYLNSISTKENAAEQLWSDAKKQMTFEVAKWPHNFISSPDFPLAYQRGKLSGQLVVKDRYINKYSMLAQFAYVGLAPVGEVGSWQTEAKGYQFWTRADQNGHFTIKKIRPGIYSLYAWVPGFIGDYKYNPLVEITPGCRINLGNIVYEPPRRGPTLWEIGKPDRTAGEFFIPNPYPTLMNHLYVNHPDSFRQYGLWERYADLYPRRDLVYQVGVSNYKKDWFFAHVTRNIGNYTFQATTWEIIFQLADVITIGNYTLQLALASAMESELQVRFNDKDLVYPTFSTGYIGKDNAIARHGIHGLYRLYSIDVPSSLLNSGKNSIYFTQTKCRGPFQGVMYDYIRLEGPTIY